MDEISQLSASQLILLAVQLCIDHNISALPWLKINAGHSLDASLLLRIILTFLPETSDPHTYYPILERLLGDNTSTRSISVDGIEAAVASIELDDAPDEQVEALDLLPLSHPEDQKDFGQKDPLIQFLIHRARKILDETGLQSLVVALLLPFFKSSRSLQDWAVINLVPSFHYEYFPGPGANLLIDLLGEENCASNRTLLSSVDFEEIVSRSIYACYSNASNGNKSRGSMKRASELWETFSPYFPNSIKFRQIKDLIAATHTLSFYALTLQAGVPFQPVSILGLEDPLSLIGKVLEQNSKAYANLDDLISIGQQFVAAGFRPTVEKDCVVADHLPPLSENDKLLVAERRVIFLAVSSALVANDFETAYSFVITRLLRPLDETVALPRTQSSPTSLLSRHDDISWRTAFKAGSYRCHTEESSSLQQQIRRLLQRMELLSVALTLAHSGNLSETLAEWRGCDEQMSQLRIRETAEAEAWDKRGDQLSINTDIRETNSTFAQQMTTKSADSMKSVNSPAVQPLSPISQTSRTSQQRVRTRDMVSRVVTGGLASGIGWVLGAKPLHDDENDNSFEQNRRPSETRDMESPMVFSTPVSPSQTNQPPVTQSPVPVVPENEQEEWEEDW